jgi:hypothetical protein
MDLQVHLFLSIPSLWKNSLNISYLLDVENRSVNSCLKYLDAIQQIIEANNLRTDFEKNLPKEFSVLFHILVSFKEESSGNDLENTEYDMFSLLEDIKIKGARLGY